MKIQLPKLEQYFHITRDVNKIKLRSYIANYDLEDVDEALNNRIKYNGKILFVRYVEDEIIANLFDRANRQANDIARALRIRDLYVCRLRFELDKDAFTFYCDVYPNCIEYIKAFACIGRGYKLVIKHELEDNIVNVIIDKEQDIQYQRYASSSTVAEDIKSLIDWYSK